MTYDPEADALYVSFSDSPPHEAHETADGLIVHLDAEGRIVGVEAIGASARLAPGAWRNAPLPEAGMLAAE